MNGDARRFCVDFRALNVCVCVCVCGTVICWNRRCVCFYCCVFELEGAVGVYLMQYEVVIVSNPHVLSKYNTMAMIALHS